MEPRVKWSMASYRKAQNILASGEGTDDDVLHLGAMVTDFEKDIAEGWEPPSGETKAPAHRTAQEVDISGVYDPGRMTGQLSQGLMHKAPAAPEVGAGDNLAAAQAALDAPSIHDASFRSASKQKALYADPIYTPEGEEGEEWMGEQQPYFHQEPSVAQFIDYIERAKESTDRPEMHAQWETALADAEERGDESEYFHEFADRQWQEVRRVMSSHRVPVTRIAHQDIAKGNLGARLEGEFARIAEPFIAGGDQMATFGAGAEALAMYGNKRYSPHQEQALAELEEGGTLMPMSARIKDIVEASPWAAGAGMIGRALLPTGAANLLYKAGATATAATRP